MGQGLFHWHPKRAKKDEELAVITGNLIRDFLLDFLNEMIQCCVQNHFLFYGLNLLT
jgi:hypothetical protein